MTAAPRPPSPGTPAVQPAPPRDDDPLKHLTPGKRFEQAIERRDAMVRERRVAADGARQKKEAP